MLPETLPITGLPTGKIPASVIVCGDPARATTIAIEFVASNTTTMENYDPQILVYPNPVQSHLNITTSPLVDKIYITESPSI